MYSSVMIMLPLALIAFEDSFWLWNCPKQDVQLCSLFPPLIWKNVFILFLSEMSSCDVRMAFYVACRCSDHFSIFFTPVQHSALEEHFVMFTGVLVMYRQTLPPFVS